MEIPSKLSLEQEFKLKLLQEQTRSLSLEQAQDYVVELIRQIMVKDNLLKQFLKHDSSPPSLL